MTGTAERRGCACLRRRASTRSLRELFAVTTSSRLSTRNAAPRGSRGSLANTHNGRRAWCEHGAREFVDERRSPARARRGSDAPSRQPRGPSRSSAFGLYILHDAALRAAAPARSSPRSLERRSIRSWSKHSWPNRPRQSSSSSRRRFSRRNVAWPVVAMSESPRARPCAPQSSKGGSLDLATSHARRRRGLRRRRRSRASR